jgi:hypothetical protein
MYENINKMMENLEINSQKQEFVKPNLDYIDYFGKLHDAYIRYNYILENMDFKSETMFIRNNIKIFIDHFIEYKMDPFLLYKFVEEIDCQIKNSKTWGIFN